LELEIIVRSLIIRISLSASENLGTIKNTLSFHQFFEVMRVGSCITVGTLVYIGEELGVC